MNSEVTPYHQYQSVSNEPTSVRTVRVLSGVADVCEWYDDAEQQFKIEVKVSNKVWGPLFGYKGHFHVD